MKKKNQAAVALGRLGGKSRLKAMTPEERSQQARGAVLERWKKTKKTKKDKTQW